MCFFNTESTVKRQVGISPRYQYPKGSPEQERMEGLRQYLEEENSKEDGSDVSDLIDGLENGPAWARDE